MYHTAQSHKQEHGVIQEVPNSIQTQNTLTAIWVLYGRRGIAALQPKPQKNTSCS